MIFNTRVVFNVVSFCSGSIIKESEEYDYYNIQS